MTVLTVRTDKIRIGSDDLSVTLRNFGEPVEMMTALMVRTTRLWCYLAKCIAEGKRIIDPLDSVETLVSQQFEGYSFEPFSETRCTVFDISKRLSMTVHSDTLPQAALDVFWAYEDARTELLGAIQNAPPEASQAPQTNAPAGGAIPLSNMAIIAQRAPTPNTPQYADGQQVQFTVNKIVAGSNKGSATFALWGELGQKYPLMTVYKFKPNSTEIKPDYAKIAPLIEGLGLSLDRPEVSGNWLVLCKAAHSKGKEFMNIIGMSAIE